MCVSVCVVGPQSWMLWCLVISSLYWRPGWPALSWQSGSRATATCCLSADASNRPTSKTRAPEGLKITFLTLYHHSLYILSFLLSFPNSLQHCKNRVPSWFSFLPPLAFCSCIVTWCRKEHLYKELGQNIPRIIFLLIRIGSIKVPKKPWKDHSWR